ncbi:DUF2461 domain-containing protein [Jatrophihabitans sp.]|uniref:DUF2461 domain-containing protein n=1 Tax=Jatrophihabitans sp. TaxID=1932789 RepID=UPI0030C69D22|nr:hypothetical protein [Jatrophihabitans sp.]
MSFTGFPVAALDFYEDLEDDNSKTFWAAHKHVYDESVKAPMEALVAAVEKEFGPAKLFRPYRDVRFAKDKTPYKTHQGAWFGESSVYVQLGADGLFVAAGYWQSETPQVERLRRAVADDVAGPALERAISEVTKKGMTIGGQRLTRVPSAYPKDHPRGDLLRHKTLTASKSFGSPEWLQTKRAQTEIVKAWRALTPLVTWLDTHVGRA